MRGGGMNGSTAWADAQQHDAPLFVPTRLELMASGVFWVDNLDAPDNFTRQGATHLCIVAEACVLTDAYKVCIYDWFIQGLLTSGAYTDSDIYRAQWAWIQSEQDTAKGDADNG